MSGVRWIEDHPYDERTPLWTRANAGEVLPLPPTPLGFDLTFANGGSLAGWRDCAIERYGAQPDELHPDPTRCDFAGTIGGYLYLGATWFRIWAERTPGMSAAAIDEAYFGDHPDVPPYEAESWHTSESATETMNDWLAWVMQNRDQSELETQRQQARQIRAERPALTELSDDELVERAVGLRPVCRAMFNTHINQGAAASIGPGTIAGVCEAVGRPDATMRILAGLGGVDSAEPSYAMWELSRAIRHDPALTAAFDAGTAGLTGRLRSDPAHEAFCADLGAFLAEFGSRGPNEWDIGSPVWENDPDMVLALVELMRHQADDEAPAREHMRLAAERDALIAEIDALVDGDDEALGQFRAGVASAATFVPGRERSKTNIVRVIHEARMAIWELGRRAVARGDLDQAADICMLFEDELQSHVAGDLDHVGPLVEERRRHFEWLKGLEPPFIINGPAPPTDTWSSANERAVDVAVADEVIQGMPGCPGSIEGRARVIVDPTDPSGLEPGEVLIAPHTDPAWTPLFVPAAGVVVDVGAALSHAIIVSRELGIPCVVSATDATRRIPDGSLVRVDGSTGSVTVVELPGS
ncbi:MAG: PEP-utilizing enzyme [Acidimicrobiia bacterium]|nr:PEP-utilizing enzyme [Acidimicrobiia bacterium]